MKNLKSRFGLLVLVAAACFVFPALSKATMINISTNFTSTALVGDLPFTAFGDNNPSTNFNGLVSDIGRYETFTSTSLPSAVSAGYGDYAPGTVSLTGFDYAVLHYGRGQGGASPGGGIVFYYLNGMTGNYTFPANGLGPNGFGGLSSIRLFVGSNTSVPEGGTSVMLMGIALTGVALLRRFVFA